MDEQPDAVELQHEWVDGKVKGTIRWRGNPVHVDTLNPASAQRRKHVIKAVTEKLPQADAAQLDAELLRIADTAAGTFDSWPDGSAATATAALLDKMPKDIRDEAEVLLAHRI